MEGGGEGGREGPGEGGEGGERELQIRVWGDRGGGVWSGQGGGGSG